MLPHAAHAGQVVVELRELDLELPLGGDGVLGEDVEDQLRPVDHARIERVLEEALLRRIQLVVDDQALGLELLEALLDLLELPLADVGALRGAGTVLDRPADRDHSGRARELLDLGELLGGIDALGQHCEDEPALRLRGTWNHRAVIMPAPDPTPMLAETALALVNIPSESRSEAALYEYVAGAGAPRAGLRERRDARLRQAQRQAARAPRRASRHGSGAGQPARAPRGRLGARASARPT